MRVNNISKVLILSFYFSAVAQATSVFPRGCEVLGFAYEKNNLVINETGQQAYYLIQNRSPNKLILERENSSSTPMNPPLQAPIASMNWGAFASDEKNMYFKCYTQNAETKSLLNCQDVLDVCQYPRVKFALSNMGNYWISFDKSQNEVIQDSVAKGIYLKW